MNFTGDSGLATCGMRFPIVKFESPRSYFCISWTVLGNSSLPTNPGKKSFFSGSVHLTIGAIWFSFDSSHPRAHQMSQAAADEQAIFAVLKVTRVEFLAL